MYSGKKEMTHIGCEVLPVYPFRSNKCIMSKTYSSTANLIAWTMKTFRFLFGSHVGLPSRCGRCPSRPRTSWRFSAPEGWRCFPGEIIPRQQGTLEMNFVPAKHGLKLKIFLPIFGNNGIGWLHNLRLWMSSKITLNELAIMLVHSSCRANIFKVPTIFCS